ncbi:MAG: hypothetical protein J3R72DRAFT_530436 [Linnemannia gamsii]|nr:MAG: hypothetical protein J3R72DRAFT_530436 [Linnemannia gamsii]
MVLTLPTTLTNACVAAGAHEGAAFATTSRSAVTVTAVLPKPTSYTISEQESWEWVLSDDSKSGLVSEQRLVNEDQVEWAWLRETTHGEEGIFEHLRLRRLRNKNSDPEDVVEEVGGLGGFSC